jgi:hypothetical protein
VTISNECGVLRNIEADDRWGAYARIFNKGQFGIAGGLFEGGLHLGDLAYDRRNWTLWHWCNDLRLKMITSNFKHLNEKFLGVFTCLFIQLIFVTGPISTIVCHPFST